MDGWVGRLRDNYKSYDEFVAFSEIYGLAKRLGFESEDDAWAEDPWIHGSAEPADFGLHEFPETYLHVRECRSGEEWIRPMRGNSSMDLTTQIRKWVKEEYCGELRLDPPIQPGLEGDYYAEIITDSRPPDSSIIWTSGGFWLKTTHE